MKKTILMAVIAGLLLLPFPVRYTAQAAEAAPVAQPLVREGDLAAALVGALELGSAPDEAQAEEMLAAVGIEPQEGWVADYPVTPEIIGQLQKRIGEAADTQKLAMGRETALDAFRDLLDDLGVAVSIETPEVYAQESPPESYPEYIDPADVDDYYYRVGPPVITYYLPPPAYYPLYTWVYYPFWYSGSYFGGYFILRSFDRVITFRHRHVLVSDYGYRHKAPHFIHPQERFERHREKDSGYSRRSYFRERAPTVKDRRFEPRREKAGGLPHTPRTTHSGKDSVRAKNHRAEPSAPQRPRTGKSEAFRHEHFKAPKGKASGKTVAPQHPRSGKSEAFRHEHFKAPKGKALGRTVAPRQPKTGRSESLRHRDFKASGGKASGRPAAPQKFRKEARSAARPSAGGRNFSGRSGGGSGRLGGHFRGGLGKR